MTDVNINLFQMSEEYLHFPLSDAEAVFIVGPIFISPLHLAIGLIQGIVGGIFALLAAICYIVTKPCSNNIGDFFSAKMNESLKHTKTGFMAVLFAGANIMSLGILAYKFKNS